MRTSRLAGGLTASLFFLSLVLIAAPGAVRADAENPNVARLSLVQGSVAIGRAGSKQNVAGVVNAPIEDGDALTAGRGARAEVQFDGTSALRMEQGAQVRFATLDPSNRVIDVARGTVSLDLFDNAPTMPEIDTPSATIRADEDGRYRVTVADDGTTYVTVRAGRAEIDLPQGTQHLTPGTTMKIAGSAANPTYSVVAFVPIDDFDRFNENRDGVLIAALGSSQVSTDVAAGNLDSYGAWVYDPTYGEVWVPYANQTTGWAPYRNGSWSWGSQFGWTWVSYEPWGWAPYHYGRWFYNHHHGGWCWYPPHQRRTPWAPALVGWLTFGSGSFNLSLGIGNVAWVPLGPGEPYHPWYAYNHHRGWYGTTIGNTVGITNVNNHYHNFSHGGATSVPGRRFALGDFKHNHAVNADELRHTVGYVGAVPVQATANNAAFNTSRRLPANLRDDRFVMHRTTARRTASTSKRRSDPIAHATAPAPNHPQSAAFGGGGAWERFTQSRGNVHVPLRSNGTQRANDPWSRFQTNRGNYRAPQAQQHRQSQPNQQQQPQQPQQWQPQQRRQSQPQQRRQSQPQPEQQPQRRQAPEQRSAPPPPPPPQQRSAPPPRSDSRSSDRHDHSRDGNH